MRTAEYDRDVMIINARVLNAIAATLAGVGMWRLGDELKFIAQTLEPKDGGE